MTMQCQRIVIKSTVSAVDSNHDTTMVKLGLRSTRFISETGSSEFHLSGDSAMSLT